MKYIRIISLVLMVIFLAGYVSGAPVISGGKKADKGIPLVRDFRLTVNKDAAPKWGSVLSAESMSGVRRVHGFLALFGMGADDLKEGDEVCKAARSTSPTCKYIESVSGTRQVKTQEMRMMRMEVETKTVTE